MNIILTAIIAALILVIATLSLYLRSYASSYGAEKAKNLATKEDLKVFVDQVSESAYAARKSENLATHEDIQKIVDQVRAVTEATSRIETGISQESWERQKRWEHRQQNLVEVITYLHDLENELAVLYSTNKAAKSGTNSPATWNGLKVDANARWQQALANFERSTDLCLLNCSGETKTAIRAVRGRSKEIAAGITGGDPEQYMSKRMGVIEAAQSLRTAVRQEMAVAS